MITGEQVVELKSRWKKLCESNFSAKGDAGTCVLGAALKEGDRELVSQHDVTGAQGCLVWEVGLSDMLEKFNAEFGTSVRYYSGWMD